AYFVPDEIASILALRFHVVLPVFIVLNLLVNCLCLIVTARPKLQALHINMYIQLMAVIDLASSVAHLPFVFDFEYCMYSNYGFAFYFSYFGWMLVYLLRSLGTSALVCLSFDRFMAIWFSQAFQKVKENSQKMLIIVYIWTIVSYIPIMSYGTVIDQGTNAWVSLPGYRFLESKFMSYYMIYLQLCFGVAPSLAIIVLSTGLVTGIFKKNIVKCGAVKHNKQFYQTAAVLGVNLSYVLCFLPYQFIAATYRVDKGGCYGTLTGVMGLFWSQSLVMVWSTLNILIFFMINKAYQNEVKFLASYVPCIKKQIGKITEYTSETTTNNSNV
ncbi:unnamed protein product, partial [Meganyctiphanes norvegica]